MSKYTDKQRIARSFLMESAKSIEYHHRVQLEHYHRLQEGHIRNALAYRLPVEDIAEITGRTIEDVGRIGEAE